MYPTSKLDYLNLTNQNEDVTKHTPLHLEANQGCKQDSGTQADSVGDC